MGKKISNEKIRQLAKETARLVLAEDYEGVVNSLKPVLDTKCPFRKLDLLGKKIGKEGITSPKRFIEAFNHIINYDAMGSYVVVGSAFIPFLETKFDLVLQKTKEYIIKGDVWHVCDNMAERSLGHALVDYFDETVPYLKKFLEDKNFWVRRSAGVAIHFFSKRVRNDHKKTKKLLKLVEPHIEVKEKNTVKGIGWGLKTIGKHHPDLLTEFFSKQLKQGKKPSRLMMRKSLTYLDKEKKELIEQLYNQLQER